MKVPISERRGLIRIIWGVALLILCLVILAASLLVTERKSWNQHRASERDRHELRTVVEENRMLIEQNRNEINRLRDEIRKIGR